MTQESQFSLLKQRRFAPFFWVQFLGAFNDNVYKNALVIMLAFQVGSLSAQESNTLINLSAGLFILPFFLFSATSGQLADKYEKSRLIRYVVLIELGLMCLGAFGFYRKSVGLLLFTLFLGGVQSALFGPVKYAFLPQHLEPEEIVGGNGLVEMGTFVAILLGTILGGVLIADEAIGTTLVSITTIVVAAAGYAMSRFIPNSPPPAPELRINWNPITETMRNLRFARGDRTVFLSMLGISWFWFYGATFLAQFPSYSKEVLGGDESVVTLLLTLFSIGIGTGSLLCERLSGHKVELGLVDAAHRGPRRGAGATPPRGRRGARGAPHPGRAGHRGDTRCRGGRAPRVAPRVGIAGRSPRRGSGVECAVSGYLLTPDGRHSCRTAAIGNTSRRLRTRPARASRWRTSYVAAAGRARRSFSSAAWQRASGSSSRQWPESRCSCGGSPSGLVAT